MGAVLPGLNKLKFNLYCEVFPLALVPEIKLNGMFRATQTWPALCLPIGNLRGCV